MQLPKTLKNSSLYTFASFLQKGVGFFLIPVYTRFLTPDDYGILNVLSSVMGFLSIIFMLSLHAAATRFHFNNESKTYRASVWGTIVILVLLNSIFMGGLAIWFHNYLIDPFVGNIPFWHLSIWALLTTIFNPIYNLYQYWLQTVENGKTYTINLLSNYFLSLSLNILTIVVLGWGVFGMLFSTFVVSIAFFTYSILRFNKFINWRIDRNIAKDSAKYSIPLIPHSVSGYFSVMADRLILNRYASTFDVGLYSIANQFSFIMNTLTTSFIQALTPWFYNEMSKKEFDNKKLSYYTEGASLVFMIISVLLICFSPDFVSFMAAESFSESWKPIVFLSFGFVLNGFYYFFSKPLFYGYPQYMMYVSMVQLAVNLGFNFILIPNYGFIGAGLAFFMSELVVSVIVLVFSSKLFKKIKFTWIKLYSEFTIFFIIGLSIFYIESFELIQTRLLLKCLIVVLIVIISFIFNRKLIINFIRHDSKVFV